MHMLQQIQEAASLLLAGQPVAFPTETVYGLGAPVFAESAIQKIFSLKGRPQDNPLIVHISSVEQIPLVATAYPHDLVRRFWPGPLTLILPKADHVPPIVSAGLPTIGVRMPAHPVARALIDAVGVPLVAPSANLSGRPSSTTAQHVREDFGDQVMVLDGGPCEQGIESTILLLDPPTILRPGGIVKERLESVLGTAIAEEIGEMSKPLAPGMKYRHYSPRAKVRLVQSIEGITQSPRTRILKKVNPQELYAFFRAADTQGVDEIVVLCDHETHANPALMNRLIRAAQ